MEAHEEPASRTVLYDTVVWPRYACAFSQLAGRAVTLPPAASVLDLTCRTGRTSRDILRAMPDAAVMALDADEDFLEAARARNAHESGRRLFLGRQPSLDHLSFSDRAFTNVVGSLVDRASNDRGAVLSESRRVLRPGGQLVLTQPLHGSFVELLDMLREVATCYDADALAERVELYADALPTPEQWTREAEVLGFTDVAVEEDSLVLGYRSGTDVLEDPALQHATLPECQWCAEALDGTPEAVLYQMRERIDTYYRGRVFELSVRVGCLRARRGW
jgi:SAM-dependent methyltransferase